MAGFSSELVAGFPRNGWPLSVGASIPLITPITQTAVTIHHKPCGDGYGVTLFPAIVFASASLMELCQSVDRDEQELAYGRRPLLQ